jgi:hypothetical protein
LRDSQTGLTNENFDASSSIFAAELSGPQSCTSNTSVTMNSDTTRRQLDRDMGAISSSRADKGPLALIDRDHDRYELRRG